MRAIVCQQFGELDNLSYREYPRPEVGADEVLVRTRAVGVNFPDLLLVKGLYQAKPTLPFVPGLECAGVIDAIGENVTNLNVGDRVAATNPAFTTYAELTAVPASNAYVLPAGVEDEKAAALLCAHGTAYHALSQRAKLRPGETLLVTGAAGGTGLAAVQIGHALGARVIAACSNEKKLDIAKCHGAEAGINYRSGDLKAAVRELTNGRGVDLIYDPVGGSLAEPLSRVLAWAGRWLVIGFASGDIPNLALNLPLVKGYSVVGVFWGNFVQREPQTARRNHQHLFDLCATGKLQPHIHEVLPLENAAKALQMIATRKVNGKIVLKP